MNTPLALLSRPLAILAGAPRAASGLLQRLTLAGVLTALPLPALALDAPCAPGNASVWAAAAKDFLGTSASDESRVHSRVYFSGAEGILTEVFYPTLDRVQNVDLQLLVTDADQTWGDEERRQRQYEVSQADKRALLWQVQTTADNGRWTVSKTIFSDPSRNAVILRVRFETLEAGKSVGDYHLYLLNNPAINGSGAGSGNANPCSGHQDAAQGADNSRTLVADGRTMLVASEPGSTASALAVSRPWTVRGGKAMVSNGFVGRNDGFSDLFAGAADRSMDFRFDGAYGGNVAQMGWIDTAGSSARRIDFDVVLAFGGDEAEAMRVANATLGDDIGALERRYVEQWHDYSRGLDAQGGLADDQYYLAAMILKSIQDKSNGAMIAGLGTPWGETSGDGNAGGYHLIWSRDLFKFASALIAAGDAASARRAVDYLFNVQMQTSSAEDPYSRPGRFPQNSLVDGRPYWNGTQMDETAMPIILAWRTGSVDLWPRIKLAAEYLAHNGPATGQERWEEMGGYSPSTIAAQIAGLVCAASLADAAGDPGAATFYRQKADEWRNNVANWTFTTTGFHKSCAGCNGRYYIRINANQDPNDDVSLTFGNGVGSHGERYIVDGGFLELVRLGVMSPGDWTIVDTLPEYDALLKQTIAGKGDAWFRYNYDGYGEYNDGRNYDGKGRGRLWPIFTAERGIYEVARSGDGARGEPFLRALKAFSSPAGLIPEQVWNESASVTGWPTETPPAYAPGSATRSMRPLSWAMGEYINLVAAIRHGRSDAPAVVCQRYACDQPQTTVSFAVEAPTVYGENVYLVGSTPLLSEWVAASGIALSPADYPFWKVTLSLPAGRAFEYKYVKRDGSGRVFWEGGGNRTLATPASGELLRVDGFR